MKNSSIHSLLTVEVCNMLGHLTMLNWTIHFGRVKAHIGLQGNEVADKLANEAAQDTEDQNWLYARIPTTSVVTELKKEGIVKWQTMGRNWERSNMHIVLPVGTAETQNGGTYNTGIHCYCHRPRKDNILRHRFKLTDNPTCPCNEGYRRLNT